MGCTHTLKVRRQGVSVQPTGRRKRPGVLFVPIAVIKYPEKNSLKKSGFILVHSSRLTIYHGQKGTALGGTGVWSHFIHSQGAVSDECVCSAYFLLLHRLDSQLRAWCCSK